MLCAKINGKIPYLRHKDNGKKPYKGAGISVEKRHAKAAKKFRRNAI